MGAIRNFATGGGDGLLRNNAVLDRATKKFGSAAIRFDGASQGFVRTSETFALGAINWCLECWVSLAATQPNTTVTIAQISSPLPDQYGSGYISIQASGGLSVVAWDFNASAPLIATAINLYGAGWKHIALSRQGSTWRLFVDGAEVGTGTWAGSVGGATNALFVGGHPYGNAGMSGWADDIRLTLGQARYTANFTAPDRELPQAAPIGPGGIDQDYASVSVLLDFDAAIEDDSSNQFAVTASGSIAISAVEKKFGTHSLNCAGGHLVLPTSAKFELRASERWTIEFWVYTSTSYAPVIWSGGSANEIILTGPGRNNVMYAPSHWNAGGDAAVVGSSVAIPANTWTHIALVAESASVGKLYVGGQLGATVGAIGVDLKYIGGNGGVVGSSAFSGYLDDVRVTKAWRATPPTSRLRQPVSRRRHRLATPASIR